MQDNPLVRVGYLVQVGNKMSITISGIYAIRCIPTGKIYVGSSVNMHQRWYHHKWRLQKGIHHCPYLQRAWDKYGESCFEFTIIELVLPIDACLFDAEQKWIKKLGASNYRKGFNKIKNPARPIHDSVPKGSSHANSKLKDVDIVEICNLINNGCPQRKVASLYGIHPSTVSGIWLGKYWKHVTKVIGQSNGKRKGSEVHCAKLSEDDVVQIKTRLLAGLSRKSIASDYLVSIACIDMIAEGRTWKHVCPEISLSHLRYQKLNPLMVAEIKQRIIQGESNSQIAKDYGVQSEQIRRIRKGERWKSVTD